MSQTAVEFLIDEYFGGVENCTPAFRSFIQQAKQIEQEQIEAAFDCGYSNGEGGYRDNPIYHGCNYYEETFNRE